MISTSETIYCENRCCRGKAKSLAISPSLSIRLGEDASSIFEQAPVVPALLGAV